MVLSATASLEALGSIPGRAMSFCEEVMHTKEAAVRGGALLTLPASEGQRGAGGRSMISGHRKVRPVGGEHGAVSLSIR